jgi:hypothetical protein
MLIQVAMNNIESVEQGEAILAKWHYMLDDDQSHVVLERDIDGTVIRISGFHPWVDEDGEGGEECTCDGDDCECGDDCKCNDEDESDDEKEEKKVDEDEDEDDDDEEAEGESDEVIYLGQALFAPAGQQAHVIAQELLDDDYVGTVAIVRDGMELTDIDAFRALQADTKDRVIEAIEELGDAEAYLSMYEVMGLKD